MNKQQLAARIWRSANNMRGKISANSYKDYILGFIFYKFLSEQEEKLLAADCWDQEDIENLSEEDTRNVNYIKSRIGYFIPHKYLYSTWVQPDADFNIGDVRDALQAFNRNIDEGNREVYENIFAGLAASLDDLGDNSQHQLVAVKKLLNIIRPIPTKSNDYDVLGFIYENLIGNFAANAGKKAGEFYTPHEVAALMSDIIAYDLRDKKTISIYDPTSGSASLLLTVGQSVAKHNGNPDSVTYYAQELIKETYNLTRMNLVMRGIKPTDIKTKNADALLDDWPLKENEIDPLRVDACCSNPPYSQKWTPPTQKDERFEYGIAPKSKADYAFLLHNLYHLNADGIMTIVLPHGVLFRGGEEGTIRTKLLENGNIEAIIGLPANIFYGTGIPTVIMVLRAQRAERDVLFIDASKCYIKDGKKNRLREQDIRRVFDAYRERADIPGFAHLAAWEELESNGFNLNIPRYVDSSEKAAAPDIYASMFGGIPASEIDELEPYWQALPSLRDELFAQERPYSSLKVADSDATIDQNADVEAYRKEGAACAGEFCDLLEKRLFSADMESLNVRVAQQELEDALFERFSALSLVDEYAAYQEFSDAWKVVSGDLEIIGREGFIQAARTVDPNMVVSRKDGKDEEEEVQDKKTPWVGHILPFDIVQHLYLAEKTDKVAQLEAQIAEQEQVCADFAENLTEEERELPFVKEDGSIETAGLVRAYWEACSEFLPELDGLNAYWDALKSKEETTADLRALPARYEATDWSALKAKKDGTYTVKAIEKRIGEVIASARLDDESLAARLAVYIKAKEAERQAKRELKNAQKELLDVTCAYVVQIGDAEAREVLRVKWVTSLEERLNGLADDAIGGLKSQVRELSTRYEVTLKDVEEQIRDTENELVGMLGQLTGNECDMAGIAELRALLGGE